MKYLVFSDSHGDTANMIAALSDHPEISRVLFLGDGFNTLEKLKEYAPHLEIFAVKGNCDDCLCPLPPLLMLDDCGKRIMLVHGHNHGVKYDSPALTLAAKENGADIVCFGHTHRRYELYENGVYYFNPGSIRQSKYAYGILDITANAVLFGTPAT